MASAFIDAGSQFTGDASIVPQNITSTTNGSGVDCQLMDGPIHAYLSLGAVTGTGVDIDVKLQESDTSGGTYSDIPGATFTQSLDETTGDNFDEWITTIQRTKQWVRAVATVAGTTPAADIVVSIWGQKKILGGSGTQL